MWDHPNKTLRLKIKLSAVCVCVCVCVSVCAYFKLLSTASHVAQRIRLSMQETQEIWVQSLCWEDPLEEAMTTHSSILAWIILWKEKPGRLPSMGSQRIDMTEQLSMHARTSWKKPQQFCVVDVCNLLQHKFLPRKFFTKVLFHDDRVTCWME